MMCQKEPHFIKEINNQVDFIFQIIKEIKDQIRSVLVDKSSCSQAILRLIQMQTLLSNYDFFDDQDMQTDSYQTVYRRRNYAQIIGISQQQFSQSSQFICHDVLNHSSNSDILDERTLKRIERQQNLIRGPYRRYMIQEKIKVIELRKMGKSYTYISKFLKIPQKNIVRWCKHGIMRKEGAGRKIGDMQMEKKVIQWMQLNYDQGVSILGKDIRKKAIQFSTKTDFKSSKGWLKNFINRYKLNQKHDIL